MQSTTQITVDHIRAKIRRHGRGLIITIAVAQPAERWTDVVKIDAFGHAHWHLYTYDHSQYVETLRGTGTLRGGQTILDHLPDYLAAAGYRGAAAELRAPGTHAALRAGIYQPINGLARW